MTPPPPLSRPRAFPPPPRRPPPAPPPPAAPRPRPRRAPRRPRAVGWGGEGGGGGGGWGWGGGGGGGGGTAGEPTAKCSAARTSLCGSLRSALRAPEASHVHVFGGADTQPPGARPPAPAPASTCCRPAPLETGACKSSSRRRCFPVRRRTSSTCAACSRASRRTQAAGAPRQRTCLPGQMHATKNTVSQKPAGRVPLRKRLARHGRSFRWQA